VSLSQGSIRRLLELVEARLRSMQGAEREEIRERKLLQHCREELQKLGLSSHFRAGQVGESGKLSLP
jgi:hypothetical protein